MPPAGNYHVTVTDKDTGAFVATYPVASDGTKLPESLALESAVIDGRYDSIDDALAHAHCLVMGGPKH